MRGWNLHQQQQDLRLPQGGANKSAHHLITTIDTVLFNGPPPQQRQPTPARQRRLRGDQERGPRWGREGEAGQIHNGADDNGSGTTGLLSLCEALTAYGPMRRTVMLQWVSAEEKGTQAA